MEREETPLEKVSPMEERKHIRCWECLHDFYGIVEAKSAENPRPATVLKCPKCGTKNVYYNYAAKLFD